MHARMTVAHIQPGRFDEAVAAARETFLPAMQAQPGYRDYLVLTDAATRQMVGIGFWESETAMANGSGDSGYYQQRMADFRALVAAPMTTTTYEVAIREP